MFTGIVEEAGVIEKITPTKKSIEMTDRATLCGRGVQVGDSVAVNGCCLTAVKVAPRGQSRLIQFDLLQESWSRTNFQFIRPRTSLCSRVSKTQLAWGSTRAACQFPFLGLWQKSDAPASKTGSE